MKLIYKRIGHFLLFISLFMAISACNRQRTPTPNATQETTATETPALPSATITTTPRSTITPTEMVEEAATTATFQSPSESPSATSEPTATPRPQTSTPPVPSLTVPAPSSTPGRPLIASFTANVTEADPGDTITLTWRTSNVTRVTLYHLMPTGQFGQFWEVEPQGSFNYEIAPQERNQTNFILAASDPAENYVQESLSIALRCPDDWFFDGAPDICPATAALVSSAAEQHYEGGTMIWVQVEDLIYVLFDGDQSSWQAYTDEWAPGEPESDPEITPPAGRYQPVRGFGQVWREQPGVREQLGWAVDSESAFTTKVQRTSYARYNETYILALDDNIWKLLPERSGWEKITP